MCCFGRRGRLIGGGMNRWTMMRCAGAVRTGEVRADLGEFFTGPVPVPSQPGGGEVAAAAGAVGWQRGRGQWGRRWWRSSRTIRQFYEQSAAAVSACGRAVLVRWRMRNSPQATAMRNGTLQGGYLIMAARAAGARLRADVGVRQCGQVDRDVPAARRGGGATFWCALGYADRTGLRGRGCPRLDVRRGLSAALSGGSPVSCVPG